MVGILRNRNSNEALLPSKLYSYDIYKILKNDIGNILNMLKKSHATNSETPNNTLVFPSDISISNRPKLYLNISPYAIVKMIIHIFQNGDNVIKNSLLNADTNKYGGPKIRLENANTDVADRDTGFFNIDAESDGIPNYRGILSRNR